MAVHDVQRNPHQNPCAQNNPQPGYIFKLNRLPNFLMTLLITALQNVLVLQVALYEELKQFGICHVDLLDKIIICIQRKHDGVVKWYKNFPCDR
jgi:hypothetical protein